MLLLNDFLTAIRYTEVNFSKQKSDILREIYLRIYIVVQTFYLDIIHQKIKYVIIVQSLHIQLLD